MKKTVDGLPENWVVMANELAAQRTKETIYELRLIDRRLFAYLVSHLEDLNTTELPKQHVDVMDFAKHFDYSSRDAGTLYRDMLASIKRLMRTLVEFPNPSDPDVMILTQLLAPSKYHKGAGWFEVRISQDIAPALLRLKRCFFQYKLENLGKLGSAYAVRLYELLKSREKLANGYVEYELEDLRKILGVAEGKLTSWSHLKQKCLDYALEQVNQETDIRASYEPRKRGRRVTGVLFRIRSNPTKTPDAGIKRAVIEAESFNDLTSAERIDLWAWIRSRPSVYGDAPSKENWGWLGDRDKEKAFHEWKNDHLQTKLFSES